MMIPVLVFLTAVIFILNELSPIDPARAVLGPSASPESVENLREKLGLDDPLPTQYVNYVEGIVTEGDLGTSARLQQPVAEGVGEAFPNTLQLALVAFAFTIFNGTSSGRLGLALARSGHPSGDSGCRSIGADLPARNRRDPYLLLALDWLPASGMSSIKDAPDGPTRLILVDSLLNARPDVFWDGLEHVIMPAIAISLIPTVAVGRTLRSGLITAFNSDYVRTARSRA